MGWSFGLCDEVEWLIASWYSRQGAAIVPTPNREAEQEVSMNSQSRWQGPRGNYLSNDAPNAITRKNALGCRMGPTNTMSLRPFQIKVKVLRDW